MAALGSGGDDGGDADGEAIGIEGARAGGVEVRLEGSRVGGGADSASRGGLTSIVHAASAARAADDTTRSGDSGSVGRVGVSRRGKADTPSHADG